MININFVDRTGEIGTDTYGCPIEIVKYNSGQDMDVLFHYNGHIEKHLSYQEFGRHAKRVSDRIHRTGETNYNFDGIKMEDGCIVHNIN